MYIYYQGQDFYDELGGNTIKKGSISCVSETKLNTPDPYIMADLDGDQDDYVVVDGALIKDTSKRDLFKRQEEEKMLQEMISEDIRTRFLRELPDEQAATIPLCFEAWSAFIGSSLGEGERVEHKGKLYKVKQEIPVVLESQEPGIATAALYEVIDVKHEGTQEDPIPYDINMEVFEGKYYIDNGVVYRCIRDSGQPLYASCESLLNIYFVKHI